MRDVRQRDFVNAFARQEVRKKFSRRSRGPGERRLPDSAAGQRDTMSIYDDVLKRIVQAWQDAGNGFHAGDAAKKITDAIAGFTPLLAAFNTALEAAKAAGGGSVADARSALSVVEAQMLVLEADIASAARSDDAKIRRNRMDQLAQLAASKVQQTADGQLLENMRALVKRAGQDIEEIAPVPAAPAPIAPLQWPSPAHRPA
jgi:hypothetical protein